MTRRAIEAPRLSAVPTLRVNDGERSGWLYVWNNGDASIFWDDAIRRATPLLCQPLPAAELSRHCSA